ncbi:hypothetical protein [Burkholderia thailandensis]|uniref:hypothetical protein n=1 Tax=Burkholderia thailandensis TaxID=57975 RepID=UPI0022ABF400|nr:hypothetical protein [Burkholderia thailandensis]MCZ2903223.1 hypothetical protein [Burkholderia thailandensis]MDD1484054.1 hypothetical protein [Burkholderia thailandensis]MDD1489965.1 hypothetical protein [Burkholderia thailandensis]MDD1496305.1 hypothetical protein [Burkholderia thailandensis]
MTYIDLNASADDVPAMINNSSVISPRANRLFAWLVALLATSSSLGIVVYGGLLRAGTVMEQVWTVAASLVAALFMYFSPMFWRCARTRIRVALVVLWLLAAVTVLRGQVDVLAVANMHAADQRAQSVALVAVPPVATGPADRSVTAIEQDIAKVSIDLARVEALHCAGECRTLRIRKVELSTQLAVFNAEATEAKRHATERDWLRDQTRRAEALRESRRAEPGTALVAPLLGTTEARLDLLMNVALVVVLEGAACVGWYFVGGVVEMRGRATVDDRDTTGLKEQVVASIPEMTSAGRIESVTTGDTTASACDLVATDAGASVIDHAAAGAAPPDDDEMIAKIREAVVAGQLKRNLVSIRKFLGCRQDNAARLNRLYIERFGKRPRADLVPMS